MDEAESLKYLMAAAQFAIEPETLPVFAAWYGRMFPRDCAEPAHFRRAIAEGCLSATERLVAARFSGGGPTDPAGLLAAMRRDPGVMARSAELSRRARGDSNSQPPHP